MLEKHLHILKEQFKKMFTQSPPKIVFDEPSISNPKINAAYFPDSNTISFKSGRTFPESVRHEIFHAAQKFYLGATVCETRDCEAPAYQFERMFPRILLRLEKPGPRYDPYRDWVIIT